jgi:uncharacterized protein YfaS (alpha-2-macroglobulin family)
MSYIVGDAITITATITNSSGTATDPTELTLQVKDPSGNTALYTYSLSEITKSSTGVYYKSVALDEAGYWFWEWQATGTVAKVDNGSVHVLAQLI